VVDRCRWIGIGVLVAVLSSGCGGLPDAPGGAAGSFAAPRIEEPFATLTGVVFETFVGEQRSAQVRAATAEVAPDGDTARLESVWIQIQEPARGTIDVRSPVGVFQMGAGDFVLSGGVEGSTGAGERFATDRLRYVAAEERLRSESPVRVLRSDFVLRADRMEFAVGDRRIRLEGRVSAEADGR
jgi:LPS export ABC transporter protein LptC